MVNNRRAKTPRRLDEAPGMGKGVSMSWSVAVAGAPERDQIAEERPHAEGEADGLIRMLAHRRVRGFGALDGLLPNAATDFLAAFQSRGEALAGVADFLSVHVGGGVHQGARVFGERAHVIAGCACVLVHSFVLFLFRFGVWRILTESDEGDGFLNDRLAFNRSWLTFVPTWQLRPILGGRLAELVPKDPAEVCERLEPDVIGDFARAQMGVQQKVFGVLHTYQGDVISEVQAGALFEHLAEIKRAGVHELGDLPQAEVLGVVLLNKGSGLGDSRRFGVVALEKDLVAQD